MQKLPDDVHGSNTTSLVRVPFHGDQLDAVRDDRGAWVSIRRVCEALEIAPQVQLRKLSAKAWACVTMMVMQMPGDAQTREIAFVHLSRRTDKRRTPRAQCPGRSKARA